MKLIYMGTPFLAVEPLAALAQEHEIVLVVTQPDKPSGRSHALTPPPVKIWAQENGVAVSQPTRARDEEFIEEVRAIGADAVAVVAFGQILPRAILEMTPRGCVNLHYSLLPRWRGAAPVQHAILNGDPVTGVTTQWMAEKLDAGDIIRQQEVEILPDETSGALLERLTPIGTAVLVETMQRLADGTAPRTPQDESGVTFAPTIKKEDGLIDWTQSASAIVNRVRAFNPWPTTATTFRDGALKIWTATSVAGVSGPPGTIRVEGNRVLITAGEGAVELRDVQPAGKPRMAAADWARGARLAADEQLQ